MTTQVQINLDSRDKVSFDRLCEKLGMTAEDAFQNFVIKSLDVGNIPFKIEEPNERLKRALASRDFVSFETAEKGLAYLNGDEDE
ncbi:type II toxin-antitoxin system RelB/DinJ family antitoxin [Fructobacillus sp. CRL 2054]|uniref:type II toxin-antitoxin system antitoxin, RelB/DinJ family n=1 Tax=Fructobacillus sp. CRL 2054 TaxID=2763007 RepID=UPI0023780EF9|nr:type II toxin-antitoxin system antitoxin, RelB/DinJ family [Fructobacillus sp. CRL 2054]MDD9138254.1 type II toxin-antitoxin system RelB/DinJ family antitoxin [Fructobacillus sp. CRL 2054]